MEGVNYYGPGDSRNTWDPYGSSTTNGEYTKDESISPNKTPKSNTNPDTVSPAAKQITAKEEAKKAEQKATQNEEGYPIDPHYGIGNKFELDSVWGNSADNFNTSYNVDIGETATILTGVTLLGSIIPGLRDKNLAKSAFIVTSLFTINTLYDIAFNDMLELVPTATFNGLSTLYGILGGAAGRLLSGVCYISDIIYQSLTDK